jgi:hypothetical protein
MKTYFCTSVLCINFLCVTAEKEQLVLSAPCIKQETKYEKLLKNHVLARKNCKAILDKNDQGKTRRILWEEGNAKIIPLEQAIEKEKKRDLAQEAFTAGCNAARAENEKRCKAIEQEAKQSYESLQVQGKDTKELAQLAEMNKKLAEQCKKLREEKEKIISEINKLLEKKREEEKRRKESEEKRQEQKAGWSWWPFGKTK